MENGKTKDSVSDLEMSRSKHGFVGSPFASGKSVGKAKLAKYSVYI